ncbi:MAG: TrmB family transcriptional regulator [Candidatus Nanoarchaeia archaeon]
MKTEEVLQDIGFSKAESKVYLSLQKLGETKAGQIIKQTGLQSSVVHNSLNTLEEKGFIMHILRGKIKHYKALKPSVVKDYFAAKQKQLEQIIPAIESMQKEQSDLPEAEIFTGMQGLINATHLLIENAKPGQTFKYFAVEEKQTSDEALKLFEKIDLIKKEKKLVVRGIANSKNRKLKNYTKSELKFVNQEIPSAMNIFKDKVLLYSLKGKFTGILIKSEEIASQYHILWDELWKKAKK